MAFINVNKYVLDKVNLEDTNDGIEAFASVVLLLSSITYDMIKEGKYDDAKFHIKGIKPALETLEWFLNNPK